MLVIDLTNENGIKLFQNSQIRTKWDSDIEDYYFSVINVISVLTGSKNPRDYWYRLKKEKKKMGLNCRQIVDS